MKAFEFVNAKSVEEAVKALSVDNARALAGGMDLVPEMQEYIAQPDRVVNLKSIPGLSYIRVERDGLHLGALTTLAEIADHKAIRSDYTALSEAAGTVGSPQIRNVGTLGGNLCQRPRCWYYRDEHYVCLKKGGGRCFASDDSADNQYNAILGGGPSYIVHPSNCATALLALNASVVIAGAVGSRTVALDNFFTLPRTKIQGENVLEPNEIITEVVVPAPANGTKSAFLEATERRGFDWAISGAAIAAAMNGKTVQSSRIVLHAVAPIPWRAKKAETLLAGKPLDDNLAAQVADAALDGAKPLAKNAYKVPLTKAMVRDALARLA